MRTTEPPMWRRHSSILIERLRGLDRRGRLIAGGVVAALFALLALGGWWVWREMRRTDQISRALEGATDASSAAERTTQLQHGLALLQQAAAATDPAERLRAIAEAEAVAAALEASAPDHGEAQRLREAIADVRAH